MDMHVELNNQELKEENVLTRECLRCDELIFVKVDVRTGLIDLTSRLCSLACVIPTRKMTPKSRCSK